MKNSLHNIAQRHEKIICFLKEQLTSDPRTLAALTQVSLPTIRRDLEHLTNMGKITRKYGEVAYNYDPEFDHVPNENIIKIKQGLAQKAASYIHDGDTVFINSSSAALNTVQFLKEKRLTIISNNLKISDYEHHQQSTILLTGGEIRFPKEVLVGEEALQMIEKVNASISIIGCYGLTLEKGLTSSAFQEAKINAAMIRQTSGQVIVLADYRKLGNLASFPVGTLAEIDTLITDPFANIHFLQQLEKNGVQVIQIPFLPES